MDSNRFVKVKKSNDGTYYISNLSQTIAYVKREAHTRALRLYRKLAFSTSAATAFDVLKDAIDNKLISLSPEFGEKLMLAFENASAGNEKEKWSQALTTCRRLIEELADKLYPPIDESKNGRKLGKNQYINRLWAFMDEKIDSETNRELAKAHVDLIGHYLESALDLTHKGVHSEVTKIEVVRSVLHTYLVVGDILSYLDRSTIAGGPLMPNIHSITRDDIVLLTGIKEDFANEIIKLRASKSQIKLSDIIRIKGIGPKTLERMQKCLSFDYPPPK
jgi:DNA uptake protein ComE-like DNA-binding protein